MGESSVGSVGRDGGQGLRLHAGRRDSNPMAMFRDRSEERDPSRSELNIFDERDVTELQRSADVRKMIDIVQKVCREFKADETSPALVAQCVQNVIKS